MMGENRLRRIGILGGMGPQATILLMSRIVAGVEAGDDADHVPLLVDCNTQVPSRIKALIEKSGDDPGPVLAEMARRLEAAGAEALIMACNTAHHFAPSIGRSVRIPFLDMVALTVDKISAMRTVPDRPVRVGLLASPAVALTGLFDRPFQDRGIETVYPSEPDALLRCIRIIKSDGATDEAGSLFGEAAKDLQDRGVDVLLVACTELSIITDRLACRLPVVDSLDVLANAAIAFSRHGGHWRAAGIDPHR